MMVTLWLPVASSADEAGRLLGRDSLQNAVRRVIDAATLAPGIRISGPSISGSDDASEEDMPAAVAGTLEKLHLGRLRLSDDVSGDKGGGKGGTGAGWLFDIYSGKLEARGSGSLAIDIQKRFSADVSPGAISLKLSDGAPDDKGSEKGGKGALDIHSGKPEARGSGSLAIDIQQRFPSDVPPSAVNPVIKPSGFHILDVVRELQKPDSPRDLRTADLANLNVRVPLDALARLKEARDGLADLASRVPTAAIPVVHNLDKVVAQDFIVGILRDLTLSPPPDLTEDGGNARPEVEAGLIALGELGKLPAVDIDVTADTPIPDPDIESRRYGGISSKIRKLSDGGIEKEIAKRDDPCLDVSEGEPNSKCANKKEIAIRDDLCLDVSEGEPNSKCAIKKEVAKRSASDIVGDSENAIKQRIADKMNDRAADTLRQRIDTTLNKATARLQDTVNQSLADVADKVNVGIGRAFEELKQQCNSEADKHAANGAEYSKQANAVDIPSREYEDCDCWWSYGVKVGCHSCETADSQTARANAEARKSTLEAQAKAEGDTADKFHEAATQVMQKKNDLETTLNTIFANAAVTVPVVSTGAGDGTESDDKSATADHAGDKQIHPHAHSLIGHASAIERMLRLSGLDTINLVATGVVNAAVGSNTVTLQQVTDIGTGAGIKAIDSLEDTSIVTGAVNAAIGSDSEARQVVASIGTNDEDEAIEPLKITGAVTAAVNAAIGADSAADMRLASIDGSLRSGGSFWYAVSAPTNAAVGYNTESVLYVGNLDGDISGNVKYRLVSTAPVSAAIGSDSHASLRIGNVGDTAKLGGTFDGTIVQPAGTISAAIGYRSTSQVGIANIDGKVAGGTSVDVTTGPVISAAIGADTFAISRVGELSPTASVGGPLSIKAATGLITTFAVGDKTTARSEIGVIDANITGSATINIEAGEIMTGTIGMNTLAETVVGSVKAPVAGNVNISVTTGAINTFAVGLSNDRAIRSQTFVGNILGPVTGDQNISVVNTGSIMTLGFGLILDTPLGTVDFSKDGCTMIGNMGTGGC